MKISAQWLDDFVKWFFNASPLWVDPRDGTNEAAGHAHERRVQGERRRGAGDRGSSKQSARGGRS
jgi:hypothetical protein